MTVRLPTSALISRKSCEKHSKEKCNESPVDHTWRRRRCRYCIHGRVSNTGKSLDGYDVVFIGSPIWYGTYAPPVAEFFKTHSFAGKTVVPFCTHGGGGAGRYFVDVRKACPAATVKEGLTIRGSNQIERRLGTGVTVHHTEDDVVNWLNAVF